MSLLNKLNKKQIIGLGLVLLSYVLWGLIIVIPFLKLGLKTTSLVVTILFAGTNIFWVGVYLAGKELLVKFKIWQKIKKIGSNSKNHFPGA